MPNENRGSPTPEVDFIVNGIETLCEAAWGFVVVVVQALVLEVVIVIRHLRE